MQRVPWTKVFSVNYTGGVVVDSVRGHFPIPEMNVFATFRARCTSFTSGTVTPKLRFGFTLSDADQSANGLNFATLAAAANTSIRTVGYAIGAAAPDVAGNPLAILPPIVSVQITTIAATNLNFEIYVTCYVLG